MKQSLKWFMAMSTIVLGIMPLKADATGNLVVTNEMNWVYRSVDNVKASIATQGGEYYVVEWGDTLGTIAEALSLPVNTLQKLNNIHDEHFILVGTVIYYNVDQQTVSVIDELGEVDTVSMIDGTSVDEVLPQEVMMATQASTSLEEITLEANDNLEEVNMDIETPEVTENSELTGIDSHEIGEMKEITSANVTARYQPIQSPAKEWIAQKESGGDYNAINPTGKYIGRYQLTAGYLNGDYSIENQERVADEYVLKRYGSWEAAKVFWETHGWY